MRLSRPDRPEWRAAGVFMPVEDVSAYLACGWRLVLDEHAERDGHLLLQPPPQLEGEAA